MRFFCFWVLFFAAIFVAVAQKTIIHEPSGVKVVFPDNEKIYPDSWLTESINGQYVPLEEAEYERSERIVMAYLDMYPVSLLKENLSVVYVCHKIEFYGVAYGGTNSNKNVYLTNKGVNRNYDSAFISRVFHAEFSSILLRNFRSSFNEAAWLRCNAEGFSYGDGGMNALKSGTNSEVFDPELNRMGFINQYATSDMENDFNSFAKNMFVPRQSFLDLLENYPRLKKKSELMIEFYGSINSVFDEKYFKKIKISVE